MRGLAYIKLWNLSVLSGFFKSRLTTSPRNTNIIRLQVTLMPQVSLKENEPFDVALRRFKRSCEKAGILADVRKREFYEKPTWVRKRKAAAAVKRHQKKVSRETRRMERLY